MGRPPRASRTTFVDAFYDDFAHVLTLNDLEHRALRLLKLARAALIYLSLGMHIEERRRQGGADSDVRPRRWSFTCSTTNGNAGIDDRPVVAFSVALHDYALAQNVAPVRLGRLSVRLHETQVRARHNTLHGLPRFPRSYSGLPAIGFQNWP
ncbi:LA2681 family HEPN domain-containing protein [Paraburkholderia phytofirmans]|uniref:LA2681 family HEPN domain-containing protein n=1 Tax=Paraburkholderia phytofirmans TaxID=261302 RepID=UPI0038B92A85